MRGSIQVLLPKKKKKKIVPKTLIFFCESFVSLFMLMYFYFILFCLSSGPHSRPQEPRVQRDPVPSAEGGTGPDKEKETSQRRPVHLGDGGRQVHAQILPHWFLALL